MYNNQRCLFDLSPVSLRQRITEIFGQKINKKTVPVNKQAGKIKLEGSIVKFSFSIKHPEKQFLFINHNFIKSPYLHRVIVYAFRGISPIPSYLCYFIFLKIYLNHINIHPKKTEVKFYDKNTIYVIFLSVIKCILSQYQIISTLYFEKKTIWASSHSENKIFIKTPKININLRYNPSKYSNSTLEINSFKEKKINPIQNFHKKICKSSIIWKQETSNLEILVLFDKKIDSDMLSFQLHKKYILSTLSRSRIIIINQHRAHDRILYEYFIHLSDKKNVVSQKLLFPAILLKLLVCTIFYTISIKRGLVLGLYEISHLVHELFSCNHFNCLPLERAIFIIVSFDFIENQFK